MAEPVQCLSGTGNVELSNTSFVDSDDSSDFVLHDESVKMPVSFSLQPIPGQTDGTELRASTVSSMTADTTDPDSSTLSVGEASNHIDSLLCSLSLDLSDEQRDHAEAFIRSRANVFSR